MSAEPKALADVRAYIDTLTATETMGALECTLMNFAFTMTRPTPAGVPEGAAAEVKAAHAGWITLVIRELHRRLAETTGTVADHQHCQGFLNTVNIATFRDVLHIGIPPLPPYEHPRRP